MMKLPRLFLAFLLCAPAFGQWTPPTPEELSMTSTPEMPGAPAIILFKEEVAEDSNHTWSYYYRVKVLTDGGKDRANVELPYLAGQAGWSVDNVSGRTIHPDGSITVFTGKPYDKLIERVNGRRFQAKVFSLPNADVGSILEYRYKLRFDDQSFQSPDWYVQSDLFVRKAHYLWKPTTLQLHSDSESVINTVAWTPILPPGAAVKKTSVAGQNLLELDIADVKPMAHEPMMPPMDSLSYRVLFYYTGYRTADEYWHEIGKRWSAARNKFIGPGSAVKSTVQGLVQPSDTEEQKAHKIYDFVQTLDNTAFSRSHSANEDRAQGFKDVNSTDDVLKRKRGTDDEITELFVAMARAAGLKSYVMGISNRDRRLFLNIYFSTYQLDDYVAIVSVNGKEMYFDPGQRYCAFGHLAWKHTLASGLRQDEKGTALGTTPAESYKDEKVTRVADLALDEHGSVTGSVTMTYTGDAALDWRQEALRGDDTSLNKDLRTDMEQMLPGGMEVRVTQVDGLADSSRPLKVTYEVKGAVGSGAGKRLLIPIDLFQTNAKTTFVEAKREQSVDMHYGRLMQDAIRYRLPKSLVIESAPGDSKEQLAGLASYSNSSTTAPSAITLYRNLALGQVFYSPEEYGRLREFYTKFEAKDQEPLVLMRVPATVAAQP